MRQTVADPLSEPELQDVPSEDLAGTQRRDWHNRRRERDPLGGAGGNHALGARG